MSSSRRWLTVFGIVIGILVITTVSLVLLTGAKTVVLLPAGTPQGIVQRYLTALQDKDYSLAYNYLSPGPPTKIQTYADWLRMMTSAGQPVWKATLDWSRQTGDYANVQVTISTLRPGGPFYSPGRSQPVAFQLSRINGQWLITSPTYIFWLY